MMGFIKYKLFKRKKSIRNMVLRLRFIGCDGSMGLHHGQIYDCSIDSCNNYIWVAWLNNGNVIYRCPYDSLKSLLANWEET